MKYVILCLLLTSSISITAQVKADLKQLDFISGKWTGSMEWGALEEYWSEPMGDNMLCAFRCVKDGKALFYEFILIEQSEHGVPLMKLRHFNRGNIAWEDKDNPYEYPLVQLEENKAVFESADKKTRLIYERQSKNKLLAILEREKDGKVETDSFIYSKAKP
jgi:hypothetical protein